MKDEDETIDEEELRQGGFKLDEAKIRAKGTV